MDIWVDKKNRPPGRWRWVQSVEDLEYVMDNYEITEVSVSNEPESIDLLHYMISRFYERKITPTVIHTHGTILPFL